jgi:Tfp pilus assembly protein FimT
MPLNIRSAEVTRLAGKLAAGLGMNKTEAVKRAPIPHSCGGYRGRAFAPTAGAT